jgi:GAF domain-containing protein
LYDAAQEQAYASAALLQVAQAIVSLSDIDEILGTIIRIMPILVGVAGAGLYEWDADKEIFLPSQVYGLSEDEATEFWARTFATDEFTLLNACRGAMGIMACPLELEGPRGLHAWLAADPSQEANLGTSNPLLFAVPIAVKEDLYGVMIIEEAEGGLRFRARRLEIITGIAQQAALAFQNDMLQKAMVVRERLETGSWTLAGRRPGKWVGTFMTCSICPMAAWACSSRTWPTRAFRRPSSWRSRGRWCGLRSSKTIHPPKL